MTPQIEHRNIHGVGKRKHELYTMLGSDWDAITNVPCPVEECDQTLVWYEAGYVPGYRVCMVSVGNDQYDHDSLRHRFVLDSNSPWVLCRDDCCE